MSKTRIYRFSSVFKQKKLPAHQPKLGKGAENIRLVQVAEVVDVRFVKDLDLVIPAVARAHGVMDDFWW